MRDAKPQCFHVSGKNFKGNEKFPGNIYLKPEESPEDGGFCIVNNVMSPDDLYENLFGFSFLVSKFSNLSIITCKPLQGCNSPKPQKGLPVCFGLK